MASKRADVAAYFRKRRREAKAAGKPLRRGTDKTLFDNGVFVGIDGEGVSEGSAFYTEVGDEATPYKWRQHFYTLLAASDGSEIEAPAGERLSTAQCLDFLIDAQANTRGAILVCFGASYDMTQILRDLSHEELTLLLQGDGTPMCRKYVDVTFGAYDYRIECRMRKSLKVWRWARGAEKYERKVRQRGQNAGQTYWVMSPCDKATLWDVWGFFQGTFVGALKAWLPNDPDTPLIIKMKAQRNKFTRADATEVRDYNQRELRLLVDMMTLVRDAVRNLGLKLNRWDGAGAIAAAMFKANEVKEHMGVSPPEVFAAARHAYSGGHIEMYKLGYYQGKVYHYDINSAYPHHFRNLPSLSNGQWIRGSGSKPPVAGFSLVRVQFRFRPGMRFYPLFYRKDNGTILYPECGSGWYWYPEFAAAQRFAARYGAIEFTICEWWHYKPLSNARPFGWIETYYERRKFLIDEANREGKPAPGETQTLKLGYNSCYGKTAQQVGARWQDGEIVPPSFFQLEWAGYVTAGCRAQLMDAAMQNPKAIIAVATDGIYSTEPLNLYCPPDKELGAWEFKLHDGMTCVMPGVYWLHDGEKTKHFSRGFDKETMSEAGFVHNAWKAGYSSIDVKMQRLITLGSALMSEDFWTMRGCFVEGTRTLRLNGFNSKRWPVTISTHKPHLGLVPTHPINTEVDDEGVISAAYPIEWLDMDESAESEEPTETTRSAILDAFAVSDELDAALY